MKFLGIMFYCLKSELLEGVLIIAFKLIHTEARSLSKGGFVFFSLIITINPKYDISVVRMDPLLFVYFQAVLQLFLKEGKFDVNVIYKYYVNVNDNFTLSFVLRYSYRCVMVK